MLFMHPEIYFETVSDKQKYKVIIVKAYKQRKITFKNEKEGRHFN